MDKVIVYVVTLNWTTGCESDALSTEVLAVFSKEELAKSYNPDIKWNKYYEGYLDIEKVEFNPVVHNE